MCEAAINKKYSLRCGQPAYDLDLQYARDLSRLREDIKAVERLFFICGEGQKFVEL